MLVMQGDRGAVNRDEVPHDHGTFIQGWAAGRAEHTQGSRPRSTVRGLVAVEHFSVRADMCRDRSTCAVGPRVRPPRCDANGCPPCASHRPAAARPWPTEVGALGLSPPRGAADPATGARPARRGVCDPAVPCTGSALRTVRPAGGRIESRRREKGRWSRSPPSGRAEPV
jgi:hypothetical protein